MVRPVTGAKDVVEGNAHRYGVKGTTLNSPIRKSTRSYVSDYHTRYENQLAGTSISPDRPVPTPRTDGSERARPSPVTTAWSNSKQALRYHNDSFVFSPAKRTDPENYARLGKQMLAERSTSKANVTSPDAAEAQLWTRRKKTTPFGNHTRPQLLLR
jgi:hypothetical protein